MSLTLEKIKEKKNGINNILKGGDYQKAEASYKELIEEINNLSSPSKEILEEKKFVLSNLALSLVKQNKGEEAKKYDIEIIRKIDPKFIKSYGRLINTYIDSNQIAVARYHYDMMKKNVPQSEIDKIPEVTSKLEKYVQIKDSEVNGLMALRQLLK